MTRTATAHYDRDTNSYTLTVNPSPPPAASRSTSMHDCGAEVAPTHPTANACWVASGTLTVVTMTRNRTVTAHYDPSGEEFTLTVLASPPEAARSTTGSGPYPCGTVVTATVTANDGWRLVRWSPAARVRMTRSGSVTAHFERIAPPPPPATYSLTVTVTDTGCCGSVSVSPSGPYYQDANPPVTVTLTAMPNDGYQVASWGGDCSGSGSGTTCTVTMSADRSAHVTFEAIPLPVVTMVRSTSTPASVTEGATITFRVVRSGSTAARLPVTWSVTQSGDFISGTPQTAGTIGAGNRGGIFRVGTANDSVDEPDGSVTATVTGGGSTYTIGTPSSATVTVNDNDEPPTYTVSASLEEKNNCGGWDCGGSVSVSPSGPYTPNTEITVTASLDYLTFLDEWEMTVGGVTTTHNGETLTFDITGNTTVTGYIRSVCEVMIEVCTLSREEEGGDGEQQSPPP